MTESMTIQAAMSDIKTIGKRVANKQQLVLSQCARASYITDMLAAEGGSPAVVQREMQSIADLHARLVKLRVAIQRKNASTDITVAGQTRKVAEWLTWRKEVAPQAKEGLAQIVRKAGELRKQVEAQQTPSGPASLILHFDHGKVTGELDAMEKALGELDGALSVFNATATVEI